MIHLIAMSGQDGVGLLFDATLLGTAGDDRLDGSDGSDRILGLAGDDLLQGLGGDDLLLGGPGDDTLLGGSGNDTLRGAGGRDLVQGGSGDDLIEVTQVGLETIDGGAGRDTLSLAAAKSGQVVQVFTGGPISDIEHIIGSAFDDTLEGTAGHGVLEGGDGDDHLTANGFGPDGGDRLYGGRGDDLLDLYGTGSTFFGGSGRDTFRFINSEPQTNFIADLSGKDVIDLRQISPDIVFVHAFDGHAGEATLTYDAASDRTLLSIDADGDGSGEVNAVIKGDQTGFDHFIL